MTTPLPAATRRNIASMASAKWAAELTAARAALAAATNDAERFGAYRRINRAVELKRQADLEAAT